MHRGLTVALSIAMVAMAGCSASQGMPTGGAGGSDARTPQVTAAQSAACSYQPLEPQGELEARAAASIDEVYREYLVSQREIAEGDPTAQPYEDGDRVEPRFMGYQVVACTAPRPTGMCDSAEVLVLSGGQVTCESAWEQGTTERTGRLEGFLYPSGGDFGPPITPKTQRQREALRAARNWLLDRFDTAGLTRFELSSLVFAYGQPSDEHYLLLYVNPDDPTSYGASGR